MKKYFAKYLPVEGGFKRVVKNEEGIPVDYHQEARLFLCSRDIQVGDLVQEIFTDGTLSKDYSFGKAPNTNNVGYLYDGKIHHQVSIENIIKKVGEISPEATWIKEGDEFDESEIQKNISIKFLDLVNIFKWK